MRSVVAPATYDGIEPGEPQTVVPAGMKLIQIDSEELLPEVVKTRTWPSS